MDEKGLSVATAARLVKEQLPGTSFNSANISHYRAGRSVPRPNVLRALSAVLDVDPEELAPRQQPGDDSSLEIRAETGYENDGSIVAPQKKPPTNTIPHFNITELHNGEALLQLNQKLSWATVIRILHLLKIENEEDSP
jgi:hypothetical protein